MNIKNFQIKKSASLQKAMLAIEKNTNGIVFIVDNSKKVIGIVTERDLMRKLLNNGMNPKTTKLKEIMTSPVKVADKDDELVGWLRQMSNERFRIV